MNRTKQTIEDISNQDIDWIFNLCGRYKSVDATLVLLEDGKWTLTTFDKSGLPFHRNQGQWSCNGDDIHFRDHNSSVLHSAQIDGNILTLQNGMVLKKA